MQKTHSSAIDKSTGVMVTETRYREGAEMGIPQTTGRKAARWDESRHDAVKTE
jgi:hypothetical protein